MFYKKHIINIPVLFFKDKNNNINNNKRRFLDN